MIYSRVTARKMLKPRIELWIGNCPLRASLVKALRENYTHGSTSEADRARELNQYDSLRYLIALYTGESAQAIDLKKEVIKAYQEPELSKAVDDYCDRD